MNSIAVFLIKSGLALTIFYLLYWLVLSKGTHFKFNRFVLLSGLIISFALPLMEFESPFRHEQAKNNIPSFYIDFSSINQSSVIQNDTTVNSNKKPLDYQHLFYFIYIIGSVICLLRLVYQSIRIRRMVSKGSLLIKDGHRIVCISEDFMPFSYFNTIIINRSNIVKENIDGILTHEMAHIRQYHFVDLLIVELFAVVQWFNPVIWFYERSLKEVHEYLADEATIISGYNKPWYQALLVNQAIGAEAFGLTNQFKHSLIKKRLTMISKIRTTKTAQLKGLFMLPAILLLFMVFAKPAESSFNLQSKGEIIKGQVVNTNSNKSMANVSVVVSGTTTGTKTDKDGQFTLEIPEGNTELVFSCIGYTTVKQTIVKNEKLLVKMKETDYKISFGTENEFVEEPTEAPKIKMEANTYIMAIEEKMPSFKGGTKAILEYLRTNLKYPEIEKVKGIKGVVLVSFCVNTNGKISDALVEKGISENIDKEALRLVNQMSAWNPGLQSGKPVKVKFTMPVKFE